MLSEVCQAREHLLEVSVAWSDQEYFYFSLTSSLQGYPLPPNLNIWLKTGTVS